MPDDTRSPANGNNPVLTALGIDLAALEDRIAEKCAARVVAELKTDREDGLLNGHSLDRALGISAATRNRLVKDGMPYETVGASKRYDLERCRAWLAERGCKPTTPPKPANDSIDVSRELRHGGLSTRKGAA